MVASHNYGVGTGPYTGCVEKAPLSCAVIPTPESAFSGPCTSSIESTLAVQFSAGKSRTIKAVCSPAANMRVPEHRGTPFVSRAVSVTSCAISETMAIEPVEGPVSSTGTRKRSCTALESGMNAETTAGL